MEPKKQQQKSPGGAAPAQNDPAADEGLAGKVRELEAHVKRLTDIAGRAQADLQNAKMRLEKNAEDMRKYAAESLLLRLLPTIDNFQRAFRHLPEDLREHDWVKGVTAIEQELMRQLTEMGLKRIDALHQPLDPSRHEVLLQGEGEEGKVLEVLQEGYELHGRVLRPAKVKVGAL